jgi:thiol-disulfide isomerase/thioredoxin
MNQRLRSVFTALTGMLALLLACSFAGGDSGVIPPDKRKLMSRVSYVDSSGVQHSLAEQLGKVVVVDVWATWCPPCRRSLPEIAALQAKEGSDFAVLAISVDQGGWEDVRPYLNGNTQLGLRAVLPADGKALDSFGEISGIPTTLIVDRQGRLRERWSGYYEGRAAKALQAALGE